MVTTLRVTRGLAAGSRTRGAATQGSARHLARQLARDQRRALLIARAAEAAEAPAEEGEAEPEPEPEPPVRMLWYPGGEAPEWLDNTLPGDYGFDPLGLGSDPEYLAWFQQAELQHARWAMLGVVGILVPEFLTKIGVLNVPLWSEAGASPTPIPFFALVSFQLFGMGWAEYRRYQDIKTPGSVNSDPIFGEKYSCTGKDVGYPGGAWFDPLNIGSNSDKEFELRQKEIKNGRLAMVAILGFSVQTFVTHKGPIQNLQDHFVDPGHQTIFTNMGH